MCIHKMYQGVGNINHAQNIANKILKDKKIGTELHIVYFNGYAHFKKLEDGILVFPFL